MSILCLICVWHAIIPLVLKRVDRPFAEAADNVALGLFACIYVAFHLFFVFWVVHVVSSVSGIITHELSTNTLVVVL